MKSLSPATYPKRRWFADKFTIRIPLAIHGNDVNEIRMKERTFIIGVMSIDNYIQWSAHERVYLF